VPPLGADRGTALGVCAGETYGTARTDLAAGDTLVLYTDGLCEALGPDGGEYGGVRLRAAVATAGGLAASAAPGAIVADLDAFTGGAGVDDDVAILTARVGAAAGAGDDAARPHGKQ
jgi:sigma-B regulation protein RsbU (phosphoserine phosphatase)